MPDAFSSFATAILSFSQHHTFGAPRRRSTSGRSFTFSPNDLNFPIAFACAR